MDSYKLKKQLAKSYREYKAGKIRPVGLLIKALKENNISKATDFADYLKRQLKNKEVRKHYRAYGKRLEIADID